MGMTTDDRKKWYLGREYWYEYLRINGYARKPTEAGLKKLSKNLDINIPHLRKHINFWIAH